MLTFSSPLPAHEARAREAFRLFVESRDALYREDGSKRLSDVEHAERYAAIRGALLTDLKNVRRDVDQFREEAQIELSASEDAAPTDLLSTHDLERANALRDFAADDLASLDHGDLVARLAAVRDGGDDGSRFAYLMAARKHARDLSSKMSSGDGLGAALSGAVPHALAEVLGGLSDALVPQTRRIELAALRSRLKESYKTVELIESLHHGHENYTDAVLARSYADSLPSGAVLAPRGAVSSH